MWSRIRSVHRGANLGAFEASGENSLVGRAALPAAPATPPSSVQSELSLVRALLSGDVAAASSFLDRASATLWSVVVRLEGDGADGEAAFLHVVASLKANGYARLKGFDGRARLPTYLSFVVRDVLADRLAQRFSEAPRDAWRRFERFFERDIRRRVAQQLPRNVGINAREDAYQEVCLKLIENDYRRIRAYGGRGSFAGYVLTVVDRILIDLVRRELPRRRLPAAVARSSPLDQAIYVAIAWEACPLDAERLSVALRGRLESDPSTGDIREAMVRVAGLARLDGATPPRPAEAISLDGMVEEGGGLALADSAPTPEDYLLLAEEERSRAALVAAVAAAAAALPTEERLYLETVFSASEPLPAREIAKLMGYPVEEVYRLKQRTQRWLKEVAARLDKDTSRSV
jgi:RNA polymerase primary sigma factor